MATNYFLNQYFTTTLNVGGGIDASQTTGIIIQSVTGLDITKPGIACITYADPINTSTAEWVTYTSIDGSNELQGVTRGTEGFGAKTHSNGATIAFPLSESHVNTLATALSIGGVATNGVTTTLDEDDMATNSATALATQQSIKAYVDSGTVTMTNKTLTSPVTQGLVDGWTLATDTWTYASASTFTISGVDRTTTFTKGTRLKFTQTTVKYAVVISSSFSTNTTVTIAVNTDYTIANAAITLPYYSYQASPQGYPGWFAYTPTPNNLTVGSGTLTGRFSLTGTTASFYINFVFSSTGSAVGTAPTVTLPISALNVGVYYSSIEDYGTTRFGAYITRVDATTIQINCWSAAASHLTYALVASGVPMTWVNNDSFVISGQYEIA